MKISIAMATFNGAKYLNQQLDSFVEQTRQPDEVIISDDGSKDSTIEIAQTFASKAPFPVVLQQNSRNLGYAGNFNRALEMTSGDLIFLSDQDDVWFPEKLERIESVAKNTSAVVLMNDALLTDKNLKEVGLTKLGQTRSAGYTESSFVMGCCIAIRREFLDLILPIQEGYPSHDEWIVRIAEGIGRKYILDIPLQYYRRHGKNESQAIVNRTTGVSRIDAFKNNLSVLVSTLFDDVKTSNSKNESYYEKMLLEGVQRAANSSQGKQAEELTGYAKELEDRVNTFYKRDSIRKLGRVARLPRILRLWVEGGYKQFNGYKSALRDLIFN